MGAKRTGPRAGRDATARDANVRPPMTTVSGHSGASRRGEADALSLDRVIHERMRLGILSALAANESLTFTELRALMGTSDGNLSVHARKLEEAGYVKCHKGYEGRVPRTEFRLTTAGRGALERYLDHMEALIRAARER